MCVCVCVCSLAQNASANNRNGHKTKRNEKKSNIGSSSSSRTNKIIILKRISRANFIPVLPNVYLLGMCFIIYIFRQLDEPLPSNWMILCVYFRFVVVAVPAVCGDLIYFVIIIFCLFAHLLLPPLFYSQCKVRHDKTSLNWTFKKKNISISSSSINMLTTKVSVYACYFSCCFSAAIEWFNSIDIVCIEHSVHTNQVQKRHDAVAAATLFISSKWW